MKDANTTKSMQDNKGVVLSDSNWAMIHRNPNGDKDSPLPGPTRTNATVESIDAPNGVILMPIGEKYIFVQTGLTTKGGGGVETYRHGNLSEPVSRVDTKAAFPYLAGGLVDGQNNVWWTENNRVVRFSDELTDPLYSVRLKPRTTPYNSLNALPDGNILVSGKKACHVVGYKPVDGELPLLSTLELAEVLADSEQSDAIIPRPVQDEVGGVYYNFGTTMARFQYDASSTALNPKPTWIFECPQLTGNLNLSNPVLCLDHAFCVTQPPEDEAMQLYRVDKNTGDLLSKTVPFPEALGIGTKHTLGASSSHEMVFAICTSSEDDGGIAAIDAKNGEILWTTTLRRVGGALALSSASERVYVIDRPEEDGPCRFLAVNMKDGAITVLYETESDTDPTVSLYSLAGDGSFYAYLPPNLYRIQDPANEEDSEAVENEKKPVKATDENSTGSWSAPLSGSDPKVPAFPDKEATYWFVAFDWTDNETAVVIRGEFPHARYMSFNIYNDETGAAVNAGSNAPSAFTDQDIIVDSENQNPFQLGILRDTANRDFSVVLAPDSADPEKLAELSENVLTFPAENPTVSLFLRVYTPDVNVVAESDGMSGGVPLPGLQAVNLTTAKATSFPPTRTLPITRELFEQGVIGSVPPMDGQFYNLDTGGTYPNVDNNYVESFFEPQPDKVWIMRFRAPSYNYTGSSPAPLTASEMVRYWSICLCNAKLTTTLATIADADTVVADDGWVNVVFAFPDDDVEQKAQGLNFVPLAMRKELVIIYRNMVTNPNFAYPITNVPLYDSNANGDQSARANIGEWGPKMTECSVEEFLENFGGVPVSYA